MITNEGRVKVLDFGLADDVSAESSDGATLTSAGHTQAGIIMGTPAYRFYLGFVICRSLRASHRWPKIARLLNLPN